VGNPVGKKPLERPSRSWIILKWILEKQDGGGMDWIDLAQDMGQWRALVNTVMNLRVISNAGNFLNNCTTGGFSRRAQLHEVC
jgi:hypothetical protein